MIAGLDISIMLSKYALVFGKSLMFLNSSLTDGHVALEK